MDNILSFWQSDDLMNNWRPIKNPDTQQCSMMFGLFVIALSFFPELVSMIIFSPRANNVEINLLILEKNWKHQISMKQRPLMEIICWILTSITLLTGSKKPIRKLQSFTSLCFFVVIGFGSFGKNNLVG